MPNVICVHEQDAGIAWKHTNDRTDCAVVVRQRELVLQTILTMSNYEYILARVLNLSGDLTCDVRATGVVSTQPLDRGFEATPHPFGTVVHPGVLTGHHQYFFSLRIDPMVAGTRQHGRLPGRRGAAARPRAQPPRCRLHSAQDAARDEQPARHQHAGHRLRRIHH